MLETFRNAWRIEDIRKKIIYTLIMLLVYRLGSFVPIPFVDVNVIQEIVKKGGEGLLGFFNTLSGGALENFTIFAMSITPYINATIIMQLLTVAIPRLEQLAKEGEEGRKKIAQYSRYATIILAFLQAFGITYGLAHQALVYKNIFVYLFVALTLTAGTAFLMWLGEQITEKGIGNGISLMIFVNIVSRAPGQIFRLVVASVQGAINWLYLPFITVFMVLLIAGVIFIDMGQRRVPVQYSKRVVGRKMYGGQSTHIPMKVNQAGVIPVIFASVILSFPATLIKFINHPVAQKIADSLRWGSNLNLVLYIILIILFSYFYTAIQFDPFQIAGNIKKYGGFIPGLRPGKPTAEYLGKVTSRLTTVGAFSLAFIAVFPLILERITQVQITFTGTGLIIVVGVVLETVKQIESQMLMRSYRGFMK